MEAALCLPGEFAGDMIYMVQWLSDYGWGWGKGKGKEGRKAKKITDPIDMQHDRHENVATEVQSLKTKFSTI